ncbi:Hypothetical protein TPAS_2617 [Trichococcus pasteurii]|uniref:Uncharacterized protein n=1 Tax=Trichococcus pasteurii TaxID=43064 RepID=A0A1W1IJ71_9LACT|nr:hypothetical protein SAMN04488086_11022 [Trichococcus pasteurii]SLM52909.1 Hypothetical protein TPAS_2617 [Trichococcus pasteurii]SSB93790.1 Hypothetical protein TPAS_2617 [Trichococcus pasteurii]
MHHPFSSVWQSEGVVRFLRWGRGGAEKPANSGLAGKNVTGQHEIPRQNRLGGEKQPTETQENPPKSFWRVFLQHLIAKRPVSALFGTTAN